MAKLNQEKFEEIFRNLKPRTREVLLMILAGNTDKEIAESLNIYEGTVIPNM